MSSNPPCPEVRTAGSPVISVAVPFENLKSLPRFSPNNRSPLGRKSIPQMISYPDRSVVVSRVGGPAGVGTTGAAGSAFFPQPRTITSMMADRCNIDLTRNRITDTNGIKNH